MTWRRMLGLVTALAATLALAACGNVSRELPDGGQDAAADGALDGGADGAGDAAVEAGRDASRDGATDTLADAPPRDVGSSDADAPRPRDSGAEATTPGDATVDGDAAVDPCVAMAASLGLSCSQEGDATLTGTPTKAAGCYAYGKLTLRTGANLGLAGATSRVPSTIIAKELVIESGATLQSDAQGYPSQMGPGSAKGLAGAGHGGRGMAWNVSSGGGTYGNDKFPVTPGAGGGKKGGGGAIRICVSGKLTLHGLIAARGASGAGAGAGGGILIYADELVGSGAINARGGDGKLAAPCVTAGGAGGGGRIAIYTRTSTGFTGNTFVAGWSYCQRSSVTGSVFRGTWAP